MQQSRWVTGASVAMFGLALASGCSQTPSNQNPGQVGAPGAAGTIGPAGGMDAAGAGAVAAGTGAVAGTEAVAGTGAVAGTEAVAGSGAGGTGDAGGGAAGDGGGGNGWFTIPNSCGMPTQNATVGNACPGTPPPAIQLTTIVSGLVGPTYALQAPGDPSRIYVTEQLGPVRVIRDGTLQPQPLLDLRDIASAAINNDLITRGYSENGLMNMVFHPQFQTNRKFYLNYTKTGPRFALVEFTMREDYTVDVTTFREVGTFPQYAFRDTSGLPIAVGTANSTNHVGSSMEFGPDGCLYLSRGEGGGENDFNKTGQNTSDTESSILRIDIDNFGTPPPGNLAGYVWNYGFRNPWRMSFDRVTGDLYIGDVGQDANTGFEEVNVEPRGVMGLNYGWWPTAGDANCSAPGGCRKPAVSYRITNTQNSVIGGYVYRGSQMPGMVGRYIWADWTERRIKTFVYKGENGGQPEICDVHDTGVTVPTKVRSFGQALDGEIYVVAAGAPVGGLGSAAPDEAGTLYRIDPM
jgi:glucose/arabinose dehydrogenase